MVFQRPVLLRGTVRDNVTVGLRLRGERQIPTRVDVLLERLGLAKKGQQPAHTLSGGEHQRVALARALVLEPTALLLDEPTANLDPQNVHLIETLIQEVQAETGMTVIWVTHQPLQARRVAHSVLFLLDPYFAVHGFRSLPRHSLVGRPAAKPSVKPIALLPGLVPGLR